MVDLTKIKTVDFAGKNINCRCGRVHRVETQKIAIGENALRLLSELAQSVLPAGKVLLISCEDIFEPHGRLVLSRLNNADYSVIKHIFKSGIAPEIKHFQALKGIPEDVRLIVCFGSGTVCDIAKYLSYKSGIKLIMIPSAPSGCGYASNYSAIIEGGIKRYIKTAPPHILLCDLSVMINAPQNIIAGGFGELCSYMTTLFDMYYSKVIFGGHYCNNIEAMIYQCIDMCIAEGEGLNAKLKNGLYTLCEAQIRCSLSFQMADKNIIGSPYYAADIINHKNKNFTYGESVFISHQKIYSLYKLFFENHFHDVLMPSDKAAHAEYLGDILGIDIYKILSEIKYDTGIKTFNETKYKIEEYRFDLLKVLRGNDRREQFSSVIFKRIYQDAGYGFNQKLKDLHMGKALAVCIDFSDLKSALGYIRNTGLLEKYL